MHLEILIRSLQYGAYQRGKGDYWQFARYVYSVNKCVCCDG